MVFVQTETTDATQKELCILTLWIDSLMQHKKNTIRLHMVFADIVHIMNCKSKLKWKVVNIQTFQCMYWQIISNKNTNKEIEYLRIPLKGKLQFQRLWLWYTQPAPTVFIAHSLYLANAQSSLRGGFQNKIRMHTHTCQFQTTFALLLLLIVHVIDSQHFYHSLK